MAKKRIKQASLEGMEEPTHRDIDDAADTYYETMLARQKLSGEESEAKDNLIALMNQHKLTLYKLPDGKRVEVLGHQNVRVKKPTKAEPEESNGDGEE